MVKQGKVRIVWKSDNGKCVALVAGDGVSAFDEQLGVVIPNKGKLLTKMSEKWFTMTGKIVPNAMLATNDNALFCDFQEEYYVGRTTKMMALRMLPIEAIVRGYITGSMWSNYCNGIHKICDYDIPDGLLESQKLPEAIYTPTTKAPEGKHDENITFEQTVSVIEQAGFEDAYELAEKVRSYSLLLYRTCSQYAEERGIILADTKFEFGVDDMGILRVADEMCTPDSSRFWSREDYAVGRSQASMDKQIIRDWIKEAKARGEEHPRVPDDILELTSKKYEECYEILFG
jgi:phosphoribosylaminoimidazole-succinocarboxamide synthase